MPTVTNSESKWKAFDDEFPTPMTDVLLFSPELNGTVRIGYYDPLRDNVVISTVPASIGQIDDPDELIMIEETMSKNPTFGTATHWRYLDDWPDKISTNIHRSVKDILQQENALRDIKASKTDWQPKT